MKRKTIAGATLIGAVGGAALAVGVTLAVLAGGGESTTSTRSDAAATPTTASAEAGPGSTTVATGCLSAADIYERLRPAVVEILSRSTNSSGFGLPAQGEGSGIIVDGDGSILTNYHVVQGATSLEVRFVDGTVAEAELLGQDPGNDLALIRVDAIGQDLAVAPLGDSSALRVGDAVLAIGNPFSLEGTLTQGIVSGLGRTFSAGQNTRPIRNMIQTDAPVNPGNSGGPLIDCYGQVVGVNTLLENPTGDNVNVGIAFAVPIDTAKQSLGEMQSGGTVDHPWLGIAGVELTPALASGLGLSVQSGVYVTLVAADSPAEAAGLRGAFSSQQEAAQSDAPVAGGDVIVGADDRTVASIEDLAAYLEETKKPGDAVRLRVDRNGEELSLEATLGEWPA
ncbi:MAG: trypsin-like peptidase domain-containing protein [Chloroflexi bacterium]|nr:trypsin-like peptidase domain-containing protein [Chloroflexota bacterium]